MMSVSIIYWGLQIIEENMGNERLWDKSCTIAFYYLSGSAQDFLIHSFDAK